MEGKMNEAYSIQTLVERLGKLNNSQQSIESLSAWCVPHRKKAKQIVETWDQVFNSSSKEQRVPLLYLANDILQNSRRKGSEFVNEFWKVLPGSLKSMYENGEEQGKKVVNRLVDIWDERKVFGSRGQGLKDEIFGNAPPAPVLDNGKNSNPIKVVRKDAYSLRIKLAVGGMPEKIVSAYQTVLDEDFNEDTALSKCKAATALLDSMKKDVEDAFAQGIQQGSPLISGLQEQETVLRQCFEQLISIKSSRSSLIVQLNEAIKDQEAKLELIDKQMQAAQVEIEYANLMRQKLGSVAIANGFGSNSMPSNAKHALEMTVAEQNTTQLQQGQPLTSFVSTIANPEEEHKKAAAAVAAKLAASSSSAQVLSSILSSLVAEEAASKNSGLNAGVLLSSGSPIFPVEKKPRLEKPMAQPDMGGNIPYYGQMQQPQSGSHTLSQSSSMSVQPLSQNNQGSTSFTPPPPPLPPLPPPPGQQYAQTSGVTMGVVPFGYMGNVLSPPLPSHVSLGLTRPGNTSLPPPPPPLPQQQQLLPQQQQQQLLPQLQTPMGIYPSPGLGFFGQLQTSPSAQQQ